jgi:hypothetical protein
MGFSKKFGAKNPFKKVDLGGLDPSEVSNIDFRDMSRAQSLGFGAGMKGLEAFRRSEISEKIDIPSPGDDIHVDMPEVKVTPAMQEERENKKGGKNKKNMARKTGKKTKERKLKWWQKLFGKNR